MKETDIDAESFELHDLYLRGIFEQKISSIAESANRRLRAKFKPQEKVDKFTQNIAQYLSPLNKQIPAIGKGIARFEERPAPGFAFALQLFLRKQDTEQASAFLEAQGGHLLVYLAVLALSKEGDHRQAIDSLQGMLSQVEFNSNSRRNKSNAKSARGESALHSYLRDAIRTDPDASAKSIYRATVTGDHCEFWNDDGNVDEITLSESNEVDENGLALIEWKAIVGGKYSGGKIKYATFEKICSKIRGGF